MYRRLVNAFVLFDSCVLCFCSVFGLVGVGAGLQYLDGSTSKLLFVVFLFFRCCFVFQSS